MHANINENDGIQRRLTENADKYGKSCNKSTKLSITCNHINYNKFNTSEQQQQKSSFIIIITLHWRDDKMVNCYCLILLYSTGQHKKTSHQTHTHTNYIQNQHFSFSRFSGAGAVGCCCCCCYLNIFSLSEFSFYLQFVADLKSHSLEHSMVSSKHENCMKNGIKVYKMKSKSK